MIVRTIGGAATTDGLGAATTDGLVATPAGLADTAGDDCAWDGEGVGSGRLTGSVGGTPGAVGAAPPGCAPRSGRSLAGAHAVMASTSARANAMRPPIAA
jgi:hypothetical protein